MSSYQGRHRPSTRAERRARGRRSPLPSRLTRAPALPIAAAVALGLTAAGATAAQSSHLAGAGTAAFSAAGSTAGSATNSTSDDTDAAEGPRTKVAPDSRDALGLTTRGQEGDEEAAARGERGDRADRSEARRQRSGGDSSTAEADRSAAERKDESESPDWVEPLDDAVFTSPYGERWGRLHAGQDYAADIGTPLKSMGTGEVVGAGPMGGYGTYIDIRYTDGSVSRYGHLDSVSASVGQKVDPGDVVAKSGNTGQSTGPHLHLEIRPGGGDPVDPAPWLAERGID